MSALFAVEEEFWLNLKWHNLVVDDLEWHYHATDTSLTECCPSAEDI